MTSSPKKILLLDTGREWGGGTNSMLELLKRIDRQRFDITCCFYENYARGNQETIEAVLQAIAIPVVFLPQRRQPLWAKLSKELVRTLLFFHRAWKKAAVSRIDRRWRVQPNAAAIAALLRQGGYHTLYMNNQPSTNVEGYLAAAATQVALIQHCRIEPVLTASLVRMVNRHADAVIAVSHGVQRRLRESGVDAQRCFTVSNAIDIHQPLPVRSEVRQRFHYAEDTFIFGSIGSLIARKSNHHILQALGLFQRAHPEARWQMIIVGAGPEQAALQQLAQKEGVASRVVFTGFRNNALEYLAAFDAFILASASEGLPRVVLEAMLVHTAVIGSDVVGTSELIDHNETGLLFPYGDVQQLSQQLAVLWQDAALRQRLTRSAAARVREQYSIEHYVSGVEALLEKMTERKQHV